MIFGGVFPYIPQYNQIYRSGDAEGFSLFVCLALLTANILRIMFWFGRPFETPLLLQSILMNIAMLLMVHLCVKTRMMSDIIKKRDRSLTDTIDPVDDETIPRHSFRDFSLQHFWDWTDFQSYLECILLFTLLVGALMYLFLDAAPFVETIGFLAVFVEAMLGIPQFLRNHKNGSTRGMNRSMVIMWTCGDAFKTTYFLLREAPVQFTICGCLQIAIDLAILTQIWVYGSGSGTQSR
jgi:uncharacterized protein with PQ loop repeat